MKKQLLSIKLILLLCILIVSCTEQESGSTKPVSFTFEIHRADLSKAGRVASMNDVTSVLITVKAEAGTEVLTKKAVKIYQYGDSYVSEPVSLAPGAYVLTEFMLADADQNILYATPLKGSANEKFVNYPLPIAFNVGNKSLRNINVQVASTDTHTPESFGYVAFGIDVMIYFQASTILAENDQVALTTSTLKVLNNEGEEVYNKELSATVNNIRFAGDDQEEYTLLISKEGYGTFSRKFVYDDLINELNGAPLTHTFTPSATFLVTPSFYSDFSYNFTVEGTKKVTVDWGDGTRESAIGSLVHKYVSETEYEITITGALESITTIEDLEQVHAVTRIDIDQLSNLKKLNYSEISYPQILDLSGNKKLEYLGLKFGKIVDINLPDRHSLTYVDMDYTHLSNTEFNEMVDNLYGNALFKPTGTLLINGGGNNLFIAPAPSSAAIQQLREMQNWGWIIDPFIDEE